MSSSPDNPNKLPKPKKFSREHRLGLVVSGGVSLAIYMNGICQEFYNAVRGRGIYKLIKALTDADIVVDIISGTSAGGVNGVLLSYALANSQEDKYIKFKEFADVWKNEGDINKLFFDLDKKEYRVADKSSFFNGIKYQENISDAFEKCNFETAPKDDWFSGFGELDLFITGTDIQGKIYQVFDSTDCVIDVKDHHAIFHLKYRENGDNDFKPNETEITKDGKNITLEALAKLCRITSCFPVAFPAVTVKLEFTDNDPKPHPDQKLVEWGNLNDRIVPEKTPQEDKQKKNPNIDDDPGRGYRLHFVDGGVLDNRPFSYTIKEIYHRTAERPVFRKLFYIDPSPERFVGNPKYDDMLKPDIVQVVQDSLLSMPGYESINNDLEQINEHNEKVRRYKFLLVDLENLLDTEEKDRQNNDFYDQQRNVYLRTRLISLEDKILPLVFLKSEGLEKANAREKNRIKKLEKVANLLAEPFADPKSSSERLKLLGQLEEGIINLDVDYALRRYFFITEYVYRLLDKAYLCDWLKNKINQDIEEWKKSLKNNNKEENDDFIQEIDFKKQEIDANIKEPYIDKILSDLEELIGELNSYRKHIEAIKGRLDKLFLDEEIEIYFSELLDKPDEDEPFAEKFYKAMLWLHGQFLNEESLLNSELKIKQKTKVNIEIQKLEIRQKIKELKIFFDVKDDSILKELSDSSILKKLVKKTQKKLPVLDDKTRQQKMINSILEGDYYSYIKLKIGKYFKDFEKLDTVLYPLDYLAGVPEKQLIETFRISPEDAKLGFSSNTSNRKFKEGNRLDKKLAGDSLRAFGGFLKKSWRANDILWGRLDGLNRIVEALVTKEKIKNFEKFLKKEAEDKKIEPQQYLDRLFKEALFPESDRKCRSEEDKQYLTDKEDELKQKLKNLFPSLFPPLEVPNSKEQRLEHEEESKEDPLEEFVKSLVSVGHLLILDQEFEETMQTSIEEQLNWKLQKQPSEKAEATKNEARGSNQWFNKTIQTAAEDQFYGKQKSQLTKANEDALPIPKFNPINISFDSAITALVVKQIAKESLVSMSLKEKEEFFNKDYKIGLETWEHIPKPERLEIIRKAICIFQDIFATWQTNKTRQDNETSNRSTFWNKLIFRIVSNLIKVTIFVTIFGLNIMVRLGRQEERRYLD